MSGINFLIEENEKLRKEVKELRKELENARAQLAGGCPKCHGQNIIHHGAASQWNDEWYECRSCGWTAEKGEGQGYEEFRVKTANATWLAARETAAYQLGQEAMREKVLEYLIGNTSREEFKEYAAAIRAFSPRSNKALPTAPGPKEVYGE